MPFPGRFLDELTARNEIVDVVGGYVSLLKRGGDYWACCPFHSEKTASFHIVPDSQFYYCFGCHKGGGVINFIMEMENLSYREAVYFLAKRAGMEVPEEEAGNREAGRRRARLLELNRDAARFYYRLLQGTDGQAVREYLARRKIRRATAVRFGMGASADAWDTLLQAMTEKGYSKQDLLDAGLAVANRKGGLYDKFRNRLMLPVIDTRGEVVAFGSRALDSSEPKYMNSPDTPVYSKRRTLYGLNLAKKTKRANLILCEGNLDVVTLHQAGFDNAVASMGTALTDEQIRLLSRFTKEVVLCYDNDSAGEAATEKALRLLHNAALSVRVLRLPRRMEDGKAVKQDADDFIKYQGADAFERLLNGSENGMDFRMSQTAAKYDLSSDEGRLAYSVEAGNLIASIQSSVGRDIYTVRAAETAGVSKEAMEADVQRSAKARYEKDRKAETRRELNPSVYLVQPQERSLRYENTRSARAEEGIIRLFLLDDSLFPNRPPLEREAFSSPLYGNVFSLLWKERQEGRAVSLNTLAGELTPEEMSQITSICQQPESRPNAPQSLEDYIRVVREEAGKRKGGTDPLQAAMDRAAARKQKIQKDIGGRNV